MNLSVIKWSNKVSRFGWIPVQAVFNRLTTHSATEKTHLYVNIDSGRKWMRTVSQSYLGKEKRVLGRKKTGSYCQDSRGFTKGRGWTTETDGGRRERAYPCVGVNSPTWEWVGYSGAKWPLTTQGGGGRYWAETGTYDAWLSVCPDSCTFRSWQDNIRGCRPGAVSVNQCITYPLLGVSYTLLIFFPPLFIVLCNKTEMFLIGKKLKW